MNRREFIGSIGAAAVVPSAFAETEANETKAKKEDAIAVWDRETELVSPKDYIAYRKDGNTRGFAALEKLDAAFEKVMREVRAAGFRGISAVSLHSYFNPAAAEPFVPRASVLKALADELHAHGIPVCSIPFAGGDSEEAYFRLFDLGCDGFSSDYPSVMFSVIRKLKAGAR